MKTKAELLRNLVELVFNGGIQTEQMFEAGSKICDIQQGEPYPDFLHKLSHYIADEDIRRRDPQYAEDMRQDITEKLEAYLARKE